MSDWRPLARVDDQPGYRKNPDLIKMRESYGLDLEDDEVWMNAEYQATVRCLKPSEQGLELGVPEGRDGMLHISIHRMDRAPIGNWRIMQQIKNEVAGSDREAVEIYPAESRLVDTSNEYHLWVLPVGAQLPFGFSTGAVTSDEQTKAFNDARAAGLHRGRQEPWMRGLTTGRNPEAPVLSDEDAGTFYDHFRADDVGRADGLGG